MTGLVLVAVLFFQGDVDAVREALASDDYRAAWLGMEAQSDSVRRACQEAEILYGAGDPSRALAAASVGLGTSPEQLDLLYYAAGSAIWLQDSSTAQEYATRLRLALEHSTELKPADREQWQRAVSDFSSRCAGLYLHEEALRNAVLLAQVLAIGGLCAGLILCGLVTRKGVSG